MITEEEKEELVLQWYMDRGVIETKTSKSGAIIGGYDDEWCYHKLPKDFFKEELPKSKESYQVNAHALELIALMEKQENES